MSNTIKGRELRCGSPNKKGYHRVNIKGTTYLWHRVIAETFLPNPDNKPCINHLNGDKADNCIENLEWCTNAENRAHAVACGLHAVGEDYDRKLTEAEVRRIREQYLCGASQSTIAKIFDIGQQNVSKVVLRKAWAHVSP